MNVMLCKNKQLDCTFQNSYFSRIKNNVHKCVYIEILQKAREAKMQDLIITMKKLHRKAIVSKWGRWP